MAYKLYIIWEVLISNVSLHKFNLEEMKFLKGIHVDYRYLYIFYLIAFVKNDLIFQEV